MHHTSNFSNWKESVITKSVELENDVNVLKDNVNGVSNKIEEKNISDIAFEDYVKNRIAGSALSNNGKPSFKQ
jgi:hypothetical protein